MIRIYHNARCSTSRKCVERVKESGKEYEVVEYLKNPISKAELKEVISKLKIRPLELVRRNEKVWKEEYKDKEMSDDEIITAMLENPRLIQRPIVTSGSRAAIGRPLSNIEDLL